MIYHENLRGRLDNIAQSEICFDIFNMDFLVHGTVLMVTK